MFKKLNVDANGEALGTYEKTLREFFFHAMEKLETIGKFSFKKQQNFKKDFKTAVYRRKWN